MVFTVVLVADVGGRRVTSDLDFPARPSPAALRAEAARDLADRGLPSAVHALQVRDARGDMHDVVSPTQLTDYGDVHAILAPQGPASVRSAVSFQGAPNGRDISRAESHSTAAGSRAVVPAGYRSASPVSASAASERGKSVRSAAAALDPQVREDDQVDYVFTELDTNRTRAIRRDDFVAAFSLIPSLQGSAPDIFARCDTNCDGMLDRQEFRQFARMYPTLMDAFYHRLGDEKAYTEQATQIQAQVGREAEQRDTEARAARLHQETQAETRRCDERLNRQVTVLSASIQREQEAKKVLERSRAGATEASRVLQEANGKTQLFVEKITGHEQAVGDLEEEAGRRRHVLEQERAGHREAAARLAEIQRMLDEQTRVVRQHEERISQAAEQVDVAATSVSDEKTRLETCRQDAVQHEAAVASHQNLVAARVEEERAAAAKHRDAANEVARVQAKRDLLERELRTQHEKEAVCRTEHGSATAALGDTRKRIHAMKEENKALVAHMEQVEREERPLLRQEVELRARKDDIERFEANLRSEHKQFASRNARKQVVSTSFAR